MATGPQRLRISTSPGLESPLEKVIEQRCQTIFPLRLQTGMGERHKATSAGMVNLRASVPHQKSTRTAQGYQPLHG